MHRNYFQVKSCFRKLYIQMRQELPNIVLTITSCCKECRVKKCGSQETRICVLGTVCRRATRLCLVVDFYFPACFEGALFEYRVILIKKPPIQLLKVVCLN